MLTKYVRELRRRRVPTTMAGYSVAALGVMEAVGAEVMALPAWTSQFAVTAAVLGLPVAFALAWAFDVQLTQKNEVAAEVPERATSGVLPGRDAVAAAVSDLRRRMIEARDQEGISQLRREAEVLVTGYPGNQEARGLLAQLSGVEESASSTRGESASARVSRAAWIRRHRLQLVLVPLLAAGVVAAQGPGTSTTMSPTRSPTSEASSARDLPRRSDGGTGARATVMAGADLGPEGGLLIDALASTRDDWAAALADGAPVLILGVDDRRSMSPLLELTSGRVREVQYVGPSAIAGSQLLDAWQVTAAEQGLAGSHGIFVVRLGEVSR